MYILYHEFGIIIYREISVTGHRKYIVDVLSSIDKQWLLLCSMKHFSHKNNNKNNISSYINKQLIGLKVFNKS